jgi:hypothetical protein
MQLKSYPKSLVLILVFTLTIFASCGEKNEISPLQGTVHFKVSGLEFQQGTSPNGRTESLSFWNHLFVNQATLKIVNKNTQESTTVSYNPNNFSEAFSISLPMGNYSYTTVVEGGVFENLLPFSAAGDFSVSAQVTEVVLQADTDYGLITLKNEFVSSAQVSATGVAAKDLALSPDQQHRYMYVKGGTTTTLSIQESLSNTTITRNVNVTRKRHNHFILQKGNGVVNILDLVIGPFEYEEEIIPIGG